MRLPESIKVAGHVYKVFTMDDEWERKEGKYGDSDTGDLTIRLVKNRRVPETMLHEILHAIWYEYHLAAADNEEEAVSLLGSGLHQVFTDNPELKRLF
jgi:hypothetical protein